MTLPAPFSRLLDPAHPIPTTPGHHRARLASGAPALLTLRAGGRDAVLAEAERLCWLDGRAGAPRVVAWGGHDGFGHLLVEDRAGLSAAHDPGVLTSDVAPSALGRALRGLHALPTAECPFARPLPALLDEARTRVAAGLVTTEDLSPPYRRYGPAGLLDLVERSLPEGPGDDVVCHGDVRLDDLVLYDDGGVGLARLERLAVADRCLDLSAAIGGLVATFGPDVLGAFAEAYGIDRPPAARLDAYNLLRELL